MGKPDKQFRLRLNPAKRSQWIELKKMAEVVGEDAILSAAKKNGVNLLPGWFNQEYLAELNNLTEDDFIKLVSKDAFVRIEDMEESGVRVVNAFSFEIRTVDDLIEYHKIDTEVWEPDRVTANMWNQGSKIPSELGGGVCRVQLHQIKATFRKRIDEVTQKVRDLIEKRSNSSPIVVTGNDHSFETYLVMGCIHRPFHNKKLWSAIMQYIYDNRKSLNGFILNGDYIDMKSLSSHDEKTRMPDGFNLGYEYEDAYEGIMDLKKAFGSKWGDIFKVYHFGNHENRWFRHVGTNDGAKYGSALQSPVDALDLEGNGFHVQLDWESGYTRLGVDLDVFHGKYTGENSDKQHLVNTENTSCMYNHTHAVSEYNIGSRIAYNVGWLGDPDSIGFKYTNRFAMAKWAYGFGEVDIDSNGKHYATKVRCRPDGFYKNGRFYKG